MRFNPTAWAGSDRGGNLDQALMEAWAHEWEVAKHERAARRKDWHHDVPKTHWRQRDGTTIALTSMTDNHLVHAIRFAEAKKQHASRYWNLIAERNRREQEQ